MTTASRGSTLIELLVTISIFTVMIVMVLGIFSRFITTQRRDIAERTLQEDVRLALEVFLREARTAYASSFALAQDTSVARVGQMIVFRNQNGTCVAYKLSNESWQRAEAETSTLCEEVTYRSFIPLTAAHTKVEDIRFILPQGITASNQLQRQGFITLIIRASTREATVPPLELETTVTSRQVIPFTNSL
jgi:Tfp pilus assembly protein FimT